MNVWVHLNQPGTSDLFDWQAFELEMHDGLILYPEIAPNAARLPILGLRPIVRNQLKLIIDGARREVTLKTSGWLS